MGKAIIFRLLTTVAILLIIAVYFSPIWWVQLDAPGYTEGVPINFHVNGVFNGRQVEEGEFCDKTMYWVHEMDVLNNFVGMYPTGTGAPIERALSQFLFAFLIILLITFMISGRKLQAATLSVGFSIIVAWGYLTLFTSGGVTWMSSGYQQFVQCDMDMEPEEIQEWGGFYTMQESFRNSLNKTFQSRIDETTRMVNMMVTVAYVVIGVLIVSMLIFIMGVIWQNNLFYWLLVIIPILLPVFFVLDYAAWVGWFGHNLGDWATFTLKPFIMPTFLGESKVASFTTHSYPHYGYGLMMLSSVLLILAALLRRKQLRATSTGK
ncbi:hypothetical protein [Candidatus Parabeggiatoa sp. HSG14]|uniref:hypothetical protein n=1 Tax=Candidatus Parabeggiatoa sp. HSG14 TaxID=3055593 RepID=UPI0025A88FC8|nr:hypothetical protein [Thiotrichales bacterium HSG14]